MEKKPGRVIVRVTPIICCVLLLTLLYADYYGSNAVLFYQRVQQVSGWQVSSVSREVQYSKLLGVWSREADETAQEHDSGQISYKRSKFNEPFEVQKSRLHGSGSRVVDETTLQEHESGPLSEKSSVFHETIEVQDPRPHSPGSRIVDEPLLQGHESRQAHQSSRELNETAVEQRAQQLNISNGKVNGTVELQKSRKRIGVFHESETIGGQDSRLLNTINREAKGTIKKHDSRDSLFTRLVRGEDRTKLEATGFACDVASQSVVCVTKKPVTIDMATMTVHIRADQTVEPNRTVVRPYARQDDEDVLRNVRPVQFFLGNTTPPACQYNHHVPAVIFSSSGFTGNLFHEFNEIIIPLFITTYHLRSRVQFILMDYKPTFVFKYKRVMSRLSSYKVTNPAANPSVHCFSGAVAGLKFHDHLTLNSSDIPGGYTMHTFRQFLRQTYRLKIISVSEIKRPKLMLISRRGTRRFLNEAEMVRMMKGLGFEVIVATKPNRMSNLNRFARVVSSCSVLVGTHGAGLANELFLPDGAVMVQIEPLGLDWASAFYFGNPAEAMGIHYLRYKIEPEESTLSDIYGRNHPAITDPASIFAQGYQAARALYIDQQNMKVNLVRLRETLLEALRLTGFASLQKQ